MANDKNNTNKTSHADMVIVGGGIVGLSLAMAIKKDLGITPEIYEKAHTFATEAGAGLGMYPNGLRVIRDISPQLLSNVRAAGYPYSSRLWERHDGTEIMCAQESLLAGSEQDLEPLGIRRSRLQKVLYEYAVSQGITVHFEKPIANAEEREDGLVEVFFEDGTSRLTKVLFGADGALGKTRAIVAGKDNPALVYTGVTCFMGLSNVHREGISFPSADQDNFHAVFFPTAKGETCFQFHEPVDEANANALNWGNLSDQVSKEECQRLAQKLRATGWHERFVEPLETAFKAVRVGFALLEPRLKKWVRGRIALVGDAAHPPVPYIGQGAQQGLEDAGVVVALLKTHCLNQKDGTFSPQNFEKAMELYQNIRIKRSSRVLDFSKSLGHMQATRAGQDKKSTSIRDEVLKGEVLMYGTLPIMFTGADHDYKEDVKRAAQENSLPEVTTEATMEALDYLYGIGDFASNTKMEMRQTKQVDDALHALSSERVSILIDWVVDVLQKLLQQVIARRNRSTNRMRRLSLLACVDECERSSADIEEHNVADELKEVIELPDHNSNEAEMLEEDPGSLVLDECVLEQLRSFVTELSALYRKNPFHNFEHACNVTVNVYKLLSAMSVDKAPTLHVLETQLKLTDPLTKIAAVIAALIHDADHEGIPNTQLATEKPMMAECYRGKALAEQHSIHLGWSMLMQNKYHLLRREIYVDEKGMVLFRQLIVNIVLATDICDKDLREFRNARWEKAFSEHASDSPDHANRMATIGIEHLIQASDIAHTMSPFQVYSKWNERLFGEMYKAYLEGRSEKDPSEFWFKGEIGFFDFYIIPLAKRLQQCEIFGNLADEFLAYAQKNREEWAKRGEEPVLEMTDRVKSTGFHTIPVGAV